MLDILGITVPIYLGILAGWASTRWGLFSKADMRVFGSFVIHLAMPAMLFNALSQRRFSEMLNPTYLLVYATGTLLVAALGMWWARRVTGQGVTAAAFTAMGMTCPNSGFVGFPIILLVLGPVASVALALNMLVENFLLIPLLLALAERGRGGSGSWWQLMAHSLRRLIRNPMIIGLALGLLAALLEWAPPPPAARAINLFAQASGALSLFTIGGTLVGLPLRGMVRQVLPVAVGKLLLHPLILALVLLATAALWPLDPALRTALVVTGAVPMMSIYPVLAQRYGNEDVAAAAMLAVTVASFVTLSLLLWLLKHGLGWIP